MWWGDMSHDVCVITCVSHMFHKCVMNEYIDMWHDTCVVRWYVTWCVCHYMCCMCRYIWCVSHYIRCVCRYICCVSHYISCMCRYTCRDTDVYVSLHKLYVSLHMTRHTFDTVCHYISCVCRYTWRDTHVSHSFLVPYIHNIHTWDRTLFFLFFLFLYFFCVFISSCTIYFTFIFGSLGSWHSYVRQHWFLCETWLIHWNLCCIGFIFLFFIYFFWMFLYHLARYVSHSSVVPYIYDIHVWDRTLCLFFVFLMFLYHVAQYVSYPSFVPYIYDIHWDEFVSHP